MYCGHQRLDCFAHRYHNCDGLFVMVRLVFESKLTRLDTFGTFIGFEFKRRINASDIQHPPL